VVEFAASDGTPLVGKLSVPLDTTGAVPVVFHLHGAGPRTYDNAIQYRDAAGSVRVCRFYDFYTAELTKRGLAFFRVSKRGVSAEASGRPVIDRALFSTATPTVLLDDYGRALDALRARPEIDRTRIVLSGTSEGTRLAPELALRSPEGIVGLALMGYAADNLRDIVIWQNTVGPWRGIQRLLPAARDGALTRVEYDAAVARDATLAPRVVFASIDVDKNGVATADELATLVKPRLDAILAAVADGNDVVIWQAVSNLSAAYLRDGWDAPPNWRRLLDVRLPMAIFHGDLDNTTRVEGVHDAQAAFRDAGRANLVIHIYADHDHDLNWTVEMADRGGPLPYRDAFDFMASVAMPR
jgi:pimeloyl-ACP methyl ester carboxylesterase